MSRLRKYIHFIFDEKRDSIFFLSLILFISSILLRNTTYLYTNMATYLHILFSLMSYLSYSLAILKICIDFYDHKENLFKQKKFYLFIIFFIYLCYITIRTDTRLILYGFLILMAANNISIKKILKIASLTAFIITSLIVISSMIGLLPDWLFNRTNDPTLRHSYGFYYTTNLSHIYFFCVLVFLCLNVEKVKYTHLCIIFLINLLIFIGTRARNSFLLVIMILFVFIIYQKITFEGIKKFFNHPIIKFITKYSFFICLIFSILVALFYQENNSIFILIDKLFSYRLSLGHDAIFNYGIKLFGQYIEFIGTTDVVKFNAVAAYNYVDNAFLQIMLVNGVIFILFICYLFKKVIENLYNKNNYITIICLLFIALHSLFDPQLLYLEMNPFLFLFTPYISMYFLQFDSSLKHLKHNSEV